LFVNTTIFLYFNTCDLITCLTLLPGHHQFKNAEFNLSGSLNCQNTGTELCWHWNKEFSSL